jgi:quinolinate synthase
MSLRDEIQKLKQEKNALILAHYYQEGDLQDIADHVGDSYQLAKWGQESQADIIVLAGVVFMAESVKILNPHKKVLVPDLNAGCSLVQTSPIDQYTKWKNDNPGAIMATYINCSAEVKAVSDVIVTSSNAKKVIEAIPPDKQILFGPDRNLGRYLSNLCHRPMTIWPGYCIVHILFSSDNLEQMKKENPDAVTLAHPECDEYILMYADVVGSTSRLLEESIKNPAKKFIVATEPGIIHQMKKARPDAVFLEAPIEGAQGTCSCNNCPFMKMNTLEKIRNTLRDETNEVKLTPELITKANISLQRMMDITAGKPVKWE